MSITLNLAFLSDSRTNHQPYKLFCIYVDHCPRRINMDNSFFNMEGEDSISGDSDFLNLSGTSKRRGSDFSFNGDTSLFSGDGDQSPPMFMTPGPPINQTPAKKKKIEEMMTPAETSFSSNSSAPGDESQLFRTAIQTPAKKMDSSFSSSAPTPKMAGKAERKITTVTTPTEGTKNPVPVEPMKEMEKQQLFSAPATPPAPERKESPSTMKEMMESHMKEMMFSLRNLESHQVKGGDQLLARAAAVQEEVLAYKEELDRVSEDYRNKFTLAATFLNPASK